MKKLEMEEHDRSYCAMVADATAAAQAGRFHEAIGLALAALEHMDGMIQYRRKQEPLGQVDVVAINVVLGCAPVLFDVTSLATLEAFLKTQRRIDKEAMAMLARTLAVAKELMHAAHRCWDRLERETDCSEDDLPAQVACSDDQWRLIANAWEKMGVLRRSSERAARRSAFVTRMESTTWGKCPSCAARVKGPKRKLLADVTCPKCKSTVQFVWLSDSPVHVN